MALGDRIIAKAIADGKIESRDPKERIAALEAESEGRRKVLFEKAEELRAEWQRAEVAEAECDRLRKALSKIGSIPITISYYAVIRKIVKAALAGKGE